MVIYLFSGAKRRADVGDFLREGAEAARLQLDLKEYDLLRGGEQHNVVLEEVWNSLCKDVQKAHAVIVTPPCNTHSRALWANANGPRPVRNKQYPKGFPWLEKTDKQRCQLGNLLVDRSLDFLDWATSINDKMIWFLEHPEDLGRTRSGDDPASLWQLERVRQLQSGSVFTGAMFQC
eukprot:12403332-Karenia_brevis.AAC.1